MSEVLANVGCVAIEGRAVVIKGDPGSGKSSLALGLIDRGATLIGDDGVTLTKEGCDLIASPPPRTNGMIEVRNIGVVELPTTSAPVALVIVLNLFAERIPPQSCMGSLAGEPVPFIDLYPDSAILPLRAEWALKVHGLKLARTPFDGGTD